MQCPFTAAATCFLTPKVILGGLVVLSLIFGVFSAIWPARSIGFYQWIMERFNWKVTPLDMAKELRNTRSLGIWLIILGLALGAVVYFKFCT